MAVRKSGNYKRKMWHLVCFLQCQRFCKEDSLSNLDKQVGNASHSRTGKFARWMTVT